MPNSLPPRFQLPGLGSFFGLLTLALLIHSAANVGLSPGQFIAGLPHIGRILGEMFPPDLDKVHRVGTAIAETFRMALVGTSLGIVLSFFLAILASRFHSPFPPLYFLARMVVSLFRTVPDLVWALLFVVAVGLGPFAGTLAIVIDTIGYNDKFWVDGVGTPHTEQLHTIERWTRINYGRIVNEFTLDDPGAFSRTVQMKFTGRLLRPDLKTGGGELMEFICLEDNEYGRAANLQVGSGTDGNK